MSIGYIILIVIGILWSFGGGAYCWSRCINTYDDDSDKYFLLRQIFCHIIEGPIAWIIGIMIIICKIIQKIENLVGID